MYRVIIVGCGFAGLFAAKALRRAEVEVVVVDRTNHHLFQALLYQVATGVLSEGDIAPPIRDLLRHQRNTRVLLEGIGLETVGVTADPRRRGIPRRPPTVAPLRTPSRPGEPLDQHRGSGPGTQSRAAYPSRKALAPEPF
jgi:2-polyprenyl-6-methoxyphenol hydroxylase-like FAD-dependent oxidoreductase